jgi:hypothetical protein
MAAIKKTGIKILSGSSKTVTTKPKLILKNNQSMTRNVKPKADKSPAVAKPKKTVVTPRKRLDPSKMTPKEKKAYYDQPGYDNY